MPSDADILLQIQQAFAGCNRPAHFTNFTHCEECAEQDALLLSRDAATLRIEDVSNPGCNPIGFASPEGFAYFLPALARFVLSEPDQVNGWYGGQLLFHLCYDGRQNARLLACTRNQRLAVVKLLRHIVETRSALVDAEGASHELFQALEIWSEETPAA
jgi:hypothetical protein